MNKPLCFLRLCLSLTLAAAAAGTVLAAPFVSAHGYRITPPAGWHSQSTGAMGADALFLGPRQNGFTTNINIIVTPVPAATSQHPTQVFQTVAGLVNASLGREFTHYQPLTHSQFVAAGQPAFQLTATYQMGTPPSAVEGHQVYVLKGTHCYIFTLTTLTRNYAASNAIFTTMLHTLQWTP